MFHFINFSNDFARLHAKLEDSLERNSIKSRAISDQNRGYKVSSPVCDESQIRLKIFLNLRCRFDISKAFRNCPPGKIISFSLPSRFRHETREGNKFSS